MILISYLTAGGFRKHLADSAKCQFGVDFNGDSKVIFISFIYSKSKKYTKISTI
jgi:hypothetical protein